MSRGDRPGGETRGSKARATFWPILLSRGFRQRRPVSRRLDDALLFVLQSIGNAAFAEIVGSEFDLDAIALQDLDIIPPDFARDVG
jgi:hypothetical protein